MPKCWLCFAARLIRLRKQMLFSRELKISPLCAYYSVHWQFFCGWRMWFLWEWNVHSGWKTWKSQGIEKQSGKSRRMNYYNYSVAASIVQTEICNNGKIGDYNNATIDYSQLICCSFAHFFFAPFRQHNMKIRIFIRHIRILMGLLTLPFLPKYTRYTVIAY